MLSKQHVADNRKDRGLENFVRMLKKLYIQSEDVVCRSGVKQLLQVKTRKEKTLK
jgi:hypothetical protein